MHSKLENWIETHSGKKMYFLDPQPNMVDIEDIARSLSMQCRFSGHTSSFYSVAEHSIRVANYLFHKNLPCTIILQGLLHDASEAYLLDVPSPVKQCLINYKDIEYVLMATIMDKFGLDWPLSPEVKEADTVMLKNEARQLLPSKGASWVDKYPTKTEFDEPILGLSQKDAELSFLLWFNFLNGDIQNELRHAAVN